MRFLSSLALCTGLAHAAFAQTVLADTLSAELAASGISPTIARLEAMASPGDADRFALGGLRFLAAVETALQLRWKVGMSDSLATLPVLRLPVPDNPTPAPFQPAQISTLFRGIAASMEAARAPLEQIGDTADFGLEISLADIWFDVNANARRDDSEDLMSILGPMLLGWRWQERDPATPAPIVRFDAADAAWLAAYTHLLSGVSHSVLAYDPTPAITRAMEARASIDALRQAPPNIYDDYSLIADPLDTAAIVLMALNQQPDKATAAQARADFLAMVAQNRRFWARVGAETDNVKEWLPNDHQQSALGVTLPQGTGATWMAVLSDAEALLNGTKLAPYWRLDDAAGVNVARLFSDPRPIDLVGWAQGADALPYLQRGPLVSAQNFNTFAGMVSGDAMLFALFLN